MCGISASFDLETLEKLMWINNQRGHFSFSLTVLEILANNTYTIQGVFKGFDCFRSYILDYYSKLNDRKFYYIAHSQAPTSSSGMLKDHSKIHPAAFKDALLYHNGILKPSTIHNLQQKQNCGVDKLNTWDTQLLLCEIINSGFGSLKEIDGSFACVLINQYEVQIFRNQSSILYYDNQLNLSSTPIENMKELEINKIFQLDFNNNQLIDMQFNFQNIDNRYVFL
jgi:hypothetical protein